METTKIEDMIDFSACAFELYKNTCEPQMINLTAYEIGEWKTITICKWNWITGLYFKKEVA